MMRKVLAGLALILVLISCLGAAAPVKVPIKTPAIAKGHLWNLRDVDIRSVVDQVSRVTGKNFIVSSRVQGRVTVISSKPLKPDELYQVFLSIPASPRLCRDPKWPCN